MSPTSYHCSTPQYNAVPKYPTNIQICGLSLQPRDKVDTITTTMPLLPHKAGFVNIIGKPNVGKSTLMNTLLKEKLSITTPKAQTTRHRITGIVNGENFQIIYADTPGIISPGYALQEAMMKTVYSAIAEADVLCWVIDIRDRDIANHYLSKSYFSTSPIIILLNKCDLVNANACTEAVKYWSQHTSAKAILPISALATHHTEHILRHTVAWLPEHPPYYPQEVLTDKSIRFFTSEIIREKILNYYHQEVPYSVEVVIEVFREYNKIVHIHATINTERRSQQYILVGSKGEMLKKIGIEARKDLENFLGKQVCLKKHVKVVPRWRTKPHLVRQFGYH